MFKTAIKKEMKAQSITNAEMCRRVPKIAPQQLTNWFKNNRLLSLPNVELMCKELGLSLVKILKYD